MAEQKQECENSGLETTTAEQWFFQSLWFSFEKLSWMGLWFRCWMNHHPWVTARCCQSRRVYNPFAITAFFENLMGSPRKMDIPTYKRTTGYNFWIFRTTWSSLADSWKFQVHKFKVLSICSATQLSF